MREVEVGVVAKDKTESADRGAAFKPGTPR